MRQASNLEWPHKPHRSARPDNGAMYTAFLRHTKFSLDLCEIMDLGVSLTHTQAILTPAFVTCSVNAGQESLKGKLL